MVLLDDPIDQGIQIASVLQSEICMVLVQVFEMLVLLEHRRFIDVIVSGDSHAGKLRDDEPFARPLSLENNGSAARNNRPPYFFIVGSTVRL